MSLLDFSLCPIQNRSPGTNSNILQGRLLNRFRDCDNLQPQSETPEGGESWAGHLAGGTRRKASPLQTLQRLFWGNTKILSIVDIYFSTWGKDHCTAGLKFNKTGFDQKRKRFICMYWSSKTGDQLYSYTSPTVSVLCLYLASAYSLPRSAFFLKQKIAFYSLFCRPRLRKCRWRSQHWENRCSTICAICLNQSQSLIKFSE